jgi:hypothetical protein
MRPRNAVAKVALTAALALVALPGLAGSAAPSPEQIFDAAAFQSVTQPATLGGPRTGGALDPAHGSAGRVGRTDAFVEPGAETRVIARRRSVGLPSVAATSELKSPRYALSGYATFYDNGTTAMRLPRGTIVVVCGPGGCLQRTVTDYGPVKPSRVIDLYRPDFFAICGCPSWSGTVWVTVRVY